MNWLEKQWEWIKGFFDEDDHKYDTGGHNPSHKNLIGILMAVVFCLAFLKKVAGATDVPDIPPGWQLVILGILGIRALQSGATAYIKSKNGNDKEEKKDENQNPS